MNEHATHWTYKTTYVDIETGHVLTKKIATDKHKYIIIKTTKHVTTNKTQTIGTVSYTRECRKQPQTKLNLE